MTRFAVVWAALIVLLSGAAATAEGQAFLTQTACYLSGSSTTCFKPVAVGSMAGPANTTTSGYLSSGDWGAFNGKGSGSVTSVTASSPLTGGTITTTGSIGINAASTTVNGYLASGDWVAFNGGGRVPATATQNGYLASGDWVNFNNLVGGSVASTRNINTTSPLAGGGNLSQDRTLTISQANSTTNGYLASGDWATFNGLARGELSGSNPGSGYIGQVFNGSIANSGASFSNGTLLNTNSVQVGAGTWTICAHQYVGVGSSLSGGSGNVESSISTANNSHNLTNAVYVPVNGANDLVAVPGCIVVNVNSSTTYYLNTTVGFGSGSCTNNGTNTVMYAIRSG